MSTLSSSSLLNVEHKVISAHQRYYGVVAALAMLVIWSGYFLSLRISASSALSTTEVALLRFVVPAVLLLPLFIKHFRQILRVPLLYKMGLLIGGGIPFFWLGALGMQSGLVAQGSTLIPGVAPLFVTGIAVVVFRQSLSGWRLVGLMLIAAGVGAFTIDGFERLDTLGLFIAASFMWALFAISMRQCGLSPLVAASMVSVPSAVLLLLWVSAMPVAWGWTQLAWQELLMQALVQGVGAGVISSFLFGFAISRLGAEATSAIGSLTPVVATLLALFLLNEHVSITLVFGIILISSGVICASGLLKKA